MKSKSRMTIIFVWSLVAIALVLMPSLQSVGAQGPLALPDFDYDFETLVNNQTIFGQDQWVNAVVGNVGVRTGPGVNQTQTANGDGSSSGTGAIRPLDQPFYYTTRDTNVVWGVWGYAPSNCCNKTAIAGLLPVYFGPHQGGSGPPQLVTTLQRSSSPTQLYGDVLLHDHWYEYRVIVDFSIYGGLATLSYRDVTGGATVFTNDSVLQNVNLGFVPDASGRYGFFDVFIRNDGAGYVDNLHFDAPTPPGACIPAPPGMVAWWPGDGNANDIVGVNNGTLVGATFAPAGMVDQAFSFDGVNDFVAVPNNPSLNPGGSFTIDAWVYPRSNGFQTIVGKWGDTGDQPDQRSYVLVNTGTGALNFGISDAAHQIDGAFHTLRTPDGALTLNAWNQVAVVYDQTTGTRKIFVDGLQQATRTDPPITVLNSVARFGIGADLTSSTTSTAHFDGLIDEVEFFNRALSASEIQAIFNAGSAGKCKCVPPPSGMVGWWRGDGNGNDIIGNHNGLLEGSATFAPGKVGQAFQFNGNQSDGVNLGDVADFDFTPTSSFSVDAWINISALAIPPDDGQWIVILNYACSNTAQGLAILSNGTAGFGVRDATGVGGFAASPSAVSMNTWHHIAGVREVTGSGKVVKLFIDGILVASAPDLSTGSLVNNGPDYIGRRYTCGTNDPFNGLIDEVEIFNRALTDTEIQSIYNAGSAGKCLPQLCPQLTALSTARVWIGLKNSDDVGTKFDLLAEVLKNGAVVGTGQLNGVPGGGSGFNNAVLNTIALGLAGLPVDICVGDSLGFRLSVRVAANSGHSSGTARLWYSGKFIDTGASRDAGSRFNATIGGGTADYFLRTGVLNTTAGSSKTFVDVLVNRNVGGNPFKPFGIWSITF